VQFEDRELGSRALAAALLATFVVGLRGQPVPVQGLINQPTAVPHVRGFAGLAKQVVGSEAVLVF